MAIEGNRGNDKNMALGVSHNTLNNDPASFDEAYRCRSRLLLTVWFAASATRELII